MMEFGVHPTYVKVAAEDTPASLQRDRFNQGQCPYCGRQLFEIKKRLGHVIKREPLNVPGKVSGGECMRCFPENSAPVDGVSPANSTERGLGNIYGPYGGMGGPPGAATMSPPPNAGIQDRGLDMGQSEMDQILRQADLERSLDKMKRRSHYINSLGSNAAASRNAASASEPIREPSSRALSNQPPASLQTSRFNDGLCPLCGRRLYELKEKKKGFRRVVEKVALNIPGRVIEGECLRCFPEKETETQEFGSSLGADPSLNFPSEIGKRPTQTPAVFSPAHGAHPTTNHCSTEALQEDAPHYTQTPPSSDSSGKKRRSNGNSDPGKQTELVWQVPVTKGSDSDPPLELTMLKQDESLMQQAVLESQKQVEKRFKPKPARKHKKHHKSGSRSRAPDDKSEPSKSPTKDDGSEPYNEVMQRVLQESLEAQRENVKDEDELMEQALRESEEFHRKSGGPTSRARNRESTSSRSSNSSQVDKHERRKPGDRGGESDDELMRALRESQVMHQESDLSNTMPELKEQTSEEIMQRVLKESKEDTRTKLPDFSNQTSDEILQNVLTQSRISHEKEMMRLGEVTSDKEQEAAQSANDDIDNNLIAALTGSSISSTEEYRNTENVGVEVSYTCKSPAKQEPGCQRSRRGEEPSFGAEQPVVPRGQEHSVNTGVFGTKRNDFTCVEPNKEKDEKKIQVHLGCLEDKSSVEKDVIVALFDLDRWAQEDCETVETIVNFGGIALILNVSQRYKTNAVLQDEACSLLSRIASESETNKEIVAEEGGIWEIIDAMQYHKRNADVQESACKALMNLAGNNNDIKAVIAEGGGITLIIQAMYLHLDEPGVQQAGCGALYNLSTSPEVLPLIREAEPHDLLNGVAEAFPLLCGWRAKALLRELQIRPSC